MQTWAWTLLLAFTALCSVLVSRTIWHRPDEYFAIRTEIIQHHLDQSNGIVILGDSLVERSAIAQLWGRDVINAGISRAGASDLLRLIPMLKGRPIVLAVGVNDLFTKTPADDFRRDYRRLVEELQPIAVVGIAGHDGNELDPIIREERGGAAFIPGLPERFLVDGTHYGATGAAEWIRLLSTLS